MTILRAKVGLFWRVRLRKVELWHASGGTRMLFDLRLPRDPATTEAYGARRRRDWLFDPGTAQPRPRRKG